jgi:hypothetical protein
MEKKTEIFLKIINFNIDYLFYILLFYKTQLYFFNKYFIPDFQQTEL